MQLFAVSDEVWLALIGLASVIVTSTFGVINIFLQQRNKNVTEAKTKQLGDALAVNTALTLQSAEKMEETHRVVQQLKS